jgi:hypothetical protein
LHLGKWAWNGLEVISNREYRHPKKQPKSARWHVPETTLEIKLPPILQENRPTDRLELLVQMRERGGWRRADPDIPILKQAKAEYAKLQ